MGGIAIRGRWANARTARIYINDGLSLLAQLAPSSVQRTRLEGSASAFCPSYRTGSGGCG
eukprot:6251847-Amphidinium_carterae.1